MLSEESIKSIIANIIMKENVCADTKQVNDELLRMYQEEIISHEIYEWAISKIQHKENEEKEKDDGSVSSCDTLLTRYELDNDDLYHASLCSMVVNESTDTKQCSQLLQSSSRWSLQSVAMTQLKDQAFFPKCMIALFLDDSGNKACFVVFDDFKFQEIVDAYSGSTFGTG